MTHALHFDEPTNSVCRRGERHLWPIPATECVCGLYSYFKLPQATTDIKKYKHFVGSTDGLRPVVGAVVTGGMTIQHGTEGMRSEMARPVAFARPNGVYQDDDMLIPDLAAAFGVPVMPIDRIETYAREFGRTIDEPA